MAYSDYGGYAYKNGERVVERSDAVLSPEGIRSTPGEWPGWTIHEGRAGGSFHVLLGDGPIFVGLYKQSDLSIHRLDEKVDLFDCIVTPNPPTETYEWEGETVRYLDHRQFQTTRDPCEFEIDGHRITVYWRLEDNHYQYARLIQPDGTIWTGFSGYGVGAGLEDSIHHPYSTPDREAELEYLFPVEVTP